MERIDRNGGHVRWTEPKPETVFIFDIYGAVHEVVCDRQGRAPEPRPSAPTAPASPSVIRRWLAGFALTLLGLGILAEPGMAMHRAAPSAVLEAR